jgi:monovalent cation:H+ antiporter, CPA1 family
MLKDAGVTGRFRLLLEAESLFNDGTAAALFAVALVAVGSGVSAGGAILTFLQIALGGLACGAVVGGLSLFLLGRTEDHIVELTCTVVAAYGAFTIAEHFGFSGVLSTVVAGIVLGNLGPSRGMTLRGHESAERFWEFAAFLVNSLLFLLIGTRLAQASYLPLLAAALGAVVLVTLGRAASVYGVLALFSRTPLRLDRGSQHLLVWGGMRGALALALALGLPNELPMRHEVVVVTFAVVGFSTVVQGMTMVPALRRLLPRSA